MTTGSDGIDSAALPVTTWSSANRTTILSSYSPASEADVLRLADADGASESVVGSATALAVIPPVSKPAVPSDRTTSTTTNKRLPRQIDRWRFSAVELVAETVVGAADRLLARIDRSVRLPATVSADSPPVTLSFRDIVFQSSSSPIQVETLVADQ
ncbi:hypothetical protein C480_06361 [Natrialba aegyptia DSM 13077]|uniref:Uncharacterized protein n=1 Tax=Natrialba aegyptia DSM 13077 TaxID=1227491 RepID=M0BDE0_9EURY|nr:hypothetical protein C480_06361 [Natrialba aegyptia DSM 13077]